MICKKGYCFEVPCFLSPDLSLPVITYNSPTTSLHHLFTTCAIQTLVTDSMSSCSVASSCCWLCFQIAPFDCTISHEHTNLCPRSSIGPLPEGYVHICRPCHQRKFGFTHRGYYLTVTTIDTLALPCALRITPILNLD